MNYLETFLKEKTHTDTPIPPTDKTAKTPDPTSSVSFDSTSLVYMKTCFFQDAVETDHPAQANDGRESERPNASEASEIERIARLDAERHERDRRRKRGYDYAPAKVEPGAPCKATLHPDVVREIGRIEDEASRGGWTHGRLWGAEFWPVEARGLAALLDPGDQLSVEPEHILIIKADGSRQRFWLQS